MRVVVGGIPRPGLLVPVDPRQGWVREAVTTAMDAEPTAVSGELDVRARGKRVAVRVQADASAPGVCDRCGEPCERAVHTEVNLVYLPHSDEDDAELELGADDLDVGWYKDGELDLSDVLREALALSLPSRTTCSDTAGCDARTQALLAGGAAEGTGHPSFAALRQLQ